MLVANVLTCNTLPPPPVSMLRQAQVMPGHISRGVRLHPVDATFTSQPFLLNATPLSTYNLNLLDPAGWHTACWVVAVLQNLVGLIPLALLLGEVTEDLAIRLGETVGGLLNATFGEYTLPTRNSCVDTPRAPGFLFYFGLGFAC